MVKNIEDVSTEANDLSHDFVEGDETFCIVCRLVASLKFMISTCGKSRS